MSEDIKTLRQAIDRVDERLVEVLKERFALVEKIQQAKAEAKFPARDEAREQEILSRVLSLAPDAERDTVAAVYERLFGSASGLIETIARGVAIRDGKVLLCRAKGGASTYLPGGHIEFGETGAVALEREIREELGVEATVGELIGVIENSFLQHGKRHCEINLVYEMKLETNATTSQEGWIEFEWCPVEAVESANLLPDAARKFVRP